jgi:hypothetical protein
MCVVDGDHDAKLFFKIALAGYRASCSQITHRRQALAKQRLLLGSGGAGAGWPATCAAPAPPVAAGEDERGRGNRLRSPSVHPPSTGGLAPTDRDAGATLMTPMTCAFRVRVDAIADEAQGIRSFALVDEGGALPAFSAGAHIDVTPPDGVTHQYSPILSMAEQLHAFGGRLPDALLHRLEATDRVPPAHLCLTRVIEGTPEPRDMHLTPNEQAANDRFMPCGSRSVSTRLVLDL